MQFTLNSPFKPTGDQPEAINSLTSGLKLGMEDQVLLGVTGSGKTFTVANVIENIQNPTLVISHNKTLAAQLIKNLKVFSHKTLFLILSPITITINPKHTFHKQILILKKKRK